MLITPSIPVTGSVNERMISMDNMVRTASISIQNLCVPCGCACRYCLLSSRKQAAGVDYFRGKRIAERFVAYAKEIGMKPLPNYCVGFCAQYPQLTDNIEFNKTTGWIGAKFIQVNGIDIRSREETDVFLRRLKEAGVEQIDTTFFGDRDFHDSFAGRPGDHDFMLLLAERAAALGLICEPSIPVIKGNLRFLPGLVDRLNSVPGIGKIHCSLPDHRGRGALMENERITVDDYLDLPERVKTAMSICRYKTEAEWLAAGPLPEYTKRHLIITLREDNIDLLESMPCDEIVTRVERLDDDYYRAIPSVNELASMYGDSSNRRLYRARDLFWMWQRRYRSEHGIELYDTTDERNCSAVRM